MLRKEYIRSNTSFYVVFVFIVKKSDKRFKFYVNYRIFNTFIIFNRNAPPLIKEILIKLYIIRIYNKFDIIIIFNEIRMKKNHEKKIVFLMRYDLYKYIIMLFDLCNAFITFQTFINNVLRKYLNVFYITYFNDIFIYNNIKKEHVFHMRKILKKFQQIKLYLDINKCDFYIIQIKYFDLIIIIDEIEMNFKKINTITQWKEPYYIKNV